MRDINLTTQSIFEFMNKLDKYTPNKHTKNKQKQNHNKHITIHSFWSALLSSTGTLKFKYLNTKVEKEEVYDKKEPTHNIQIHLSPMVNFA